MLEPAYRYRAECLTVHDGDTFWSRLDLGTHVDRRLWLRVRNLYCPELAQPGGPEARAYAETLLGGQALVVETFKDRQSFARYIADIWIVGHGDFAALMIEGGHGSATA